MTHGESCSFVMKAGSTYSVKSDGTGKIDLSLAGNPDEDSDFNCTDFFGTNPTLEIDLVLTSGGKQFYYTGADDCVTSNPSDTCDHFPISGQCTKQ